MRPEDIGRHGTALVERVRREVDSSERLAVMLRRHRRRRMIAVAAAAAGVILLVVGALLISTSEEQTVVTEPPETTTRSGLRALPVEVFMVLIGDYTVDAADGACEGTGPLAGIGAGSLVHVWDESAYPSPEDSPTIALPQGGEVASDDPEASFLLSAGENTGCVFAIAGLTYDISEYEHISLFPTSDPDVASRSRVIGQRVVVTFGVEPGEPSFDPASGVASDEEWQAELDALWDSAGSGHIVGSVALWGGHHTALASSQPFCVGAARYEGIQPGQTVVVTDSSGAVVGETILRGSAYDAHEGCGLWFGLDVPPDLEVYVIEIGDHPAVAFDLSILEEFGWRINMWSHPDQIQGACIDIEPESRPMTCVLLEPPR